MKNKSKKLLAILLAMFMVINIVPFNVFAEDDDFKVVVSMEGLTLGQGLYFEPKAYTLDEINDLVKSEGYGPYTKDDLTAGIATLAFFIDNDVEYSNTGSWDSDAYLSSVKDIDTGEIDIPAIISENGGPSNEDNTGNDDDYLGEFDYGMMSGWMITVNDFMIDVGCAQWLFTDSQNQPKYLSNLGNTYVVRWQFTLSGYGADLGVDTGWGMTPYFTAANKAALYAAYAESDSVAKKAAAKSVMENLTASQDEVNAALVQITYKYALNATLEQLTKTVTEPAFGTGGGEWSVLSLARGGYYNVGDQYFEDYYGRVAETVASMAASVNLKGALHKNKSTENSRLIMALSAIGKDPTNVGGVNVLGAYDANGFNWIKKQGINGPIFTLIALDTKNYQTKDTTLRQQCVDYILSNELEGGGWALSGTAADPDITSMALQALVNYKNDTNVSAAAIRAIDALSAMQKDNGGFASWGSVNSESIAQVITALSAWGIDADKDSRFVKENGSAIDALLTFYIPEGKGFAHVLTSGGGYTGGEVNGMATDQASYALVAYDRFVNGKTALYDMSDVNVQPEINPETPTEKIAATISVPEKIDNKVGTEFNAVINLTGFPKNTRLFDCMISVPSQFDVEDITMGNKVAGGQIQYYLDTTDGKLRVVYFDPLNGGEISADATSSIELMTIKLKLNESISSLSESEYAISILGMTFKSSSDAFDNNSQFVIDTTKATAIVNSVDDTAIVVKSLYVGDGIDVIPSNKMLISIAVTNQAKGIAATYDDGTNTFELLYNNAITEKTGVNTYLLMVDTSMTLERFVNVDNYTFDETKFAPTLQFGDIDNNLIVNAQDALNSVSFWLRKTKPSNDQEIIRANVNGDSRLNTFDALGIVDYFVSESEFDIVRRAIQNN